MKNMHIIEWLVPPNELLFKLPWQMYGDNNARGLLEVISGLLNTLIPLLVLLVVAYFIYGVAKFILAAGDAEERKKGYSTMIYGIIALFVMVSFWGLIAILQNTFLDGDRAEVISAPRAW